MRRIVLYIFILISILATSANINPVKNPENDPPNILVFIADDASPDMGCYGNLVIKTPNIDSLAKNGLRFANAYLTSSQCSPSRTSMLTGQFAHTIGTEDLHHTEMSDTLATLPGELNKAGYFTGVMLKAHFGDHVMKGFDWYDDGFWPDYVQGRWFEKALGNFNQFLDKKGDQPFFMWVGFVDPHRAYGPNEKAEGNRAAQVHDPAAIQVPPYLIDDERTRIDIARYYDEIHRMDRQIGEFCQAVKDRGLAENTVVIFLSDNGYPFPRGKATVYDAGIHTPLIFTWPDKIEAGAVHDNGLVSTIDLMPTILQMAGTETPESLAGESFMSLLENPAKRGHGEVFAERNWHVTDEHIRTIRTEKYKLIRTAYSDKMLGHVDAGPSWWSLLEAYQNNSLTPAQALIFQAPRPGIELYDLENDPYEINNLAMKEGYTDTIKSLLKKLEAWQERSLDHAPDVRQIPDNLDRLTGQPLYQNRRMYYVSDTL